MIFIFLLLLLIKPPLKNIFFWYIMSGLLPANTTLQLSNNAGDITHQGVLGSNASGTSLLSSTFPTSTGTSLGHYHYTDSTTNSLKFLNASGLGEGGHQFWHSSSTQAPIKVLETNRTATTIDTSLKNTSSNVILNMVSNDLTLTNDLSQSILNHEAFSFKYNGATNTQINNSPENPNIILTSNVTNSQLSASDLTFGGTSLVTTVATNSSNIATNTSNIATNTSNIATNTSNIATNTSNIATNTSNIATNTTDINLLEVKQTNSLQVYSSPAIYADGRPMLPVPSASSNTYAQFGWYFKNSTAGWKINWYMPPATGMKVSDILGLYMRYFNCATTSNDNSPFLTVYTVPTGSGDFAPGFFHSSMTYIINTTPVANKSYTMFMNASGTCPTPSSYASNIQTMIQSPVNNPRGVYAPTESILAFVIGTNSASAVNSVEFIAQKLGVMTATGTQELLYQTLI